MPETGSQRGCCGCSCDVCAGGHADGFHTTMCQDRLWQRPVISEIAPRDVHRETAALIFEVDEADVTPEQRRAARTASSFTLHEPERIDERAERESERYVRDDGSPR